MTPMIGNYPATLPEMKVASILESLGVGFEFQHQVLGGPQEPGSARADFYIPDRSLIISVIGVYWHSDPARRAQDMMQKLALISQGIITIYITDEQIERSARYYVEAALRLEDLSGWS